MGDCCASILPEYISQASSSFNPSCKLVFSRYMASDLLLSRTIFQVMCFGLDGAMILAAPSSLPSSTIFSMIYHTS
jgi:hypothetical protein